MEQAGTHSSLQALDPYLRIRDALLEFRPKAYAKVSDAGWFSVGKNVFRVRLSLSDALVTDSGTIFTQYEDEFDTLPLSS